MEATKRQRFLARRIAFVLNIEEPDYSSFDETSQFISHYNRELTDRAKVEKEYWKMDFDESFTPDFEFVLMKWRPRNVVYFLFSGDGKLQYVGKSGGYSRILGSIRERQAEADIRYVALFPCPTEADMHILEVVCIAEFKPILNKESKPKDMPTLFESPIKVEELNRIQIFEQTASYEMFKEKTLIAYNIDDKFFNTMAEVLGKDKENLLRTARAYPTSFVYQIDKAKKILKEVKNGRKLN